METLTLNGLNPEEIENANGKKFCIKKTTISNSNPEFFNIGYEFVYGNGINKSGKIMYFIDINDRDNSFAFNRCIKIPHGCLFKIFLESRQFSDFKDKSIIEYEIL